MAPCFSFFQVEYPNRAGKSTVHIIRRVFFFSKSFQYRIRILPFSVINVSFQAPKNANIWSFQAPENSQKALPDFRGLKKPIRCLFRPLKTPTYGHFRPLKTPKRLFLISGA